MEPNTRRIFAKTAAAALLGSRMQSSSAMSGGAQVTPSGRKRSDASWFAACPYGISTHWTALSQSVRPADWRPFADTVANFNVGRYVERIAGAGASYLIFTSAHALQQLAAPCDALDRVLPGRTTKRDLIGELARACEQHRLHFILYYNHSCNHGDDPGWEHAVGYHEADKRRFVSNLLSILKEMGERYGRQVKGWWFDSCSSLDAHGPSWGDTTVPDDYRFPWGEWTMAAKAGNPDRLVTLSPGMMRYYLYSDHQDYEWGEANDLVAVPAAQFTPDGLQAHRWVCLDNPEWVHQRYDKPLVSPRFELQHLVAYVKTAHRFSVPVTFNVDVDRNGEMLRETLELLHQVHQKVS
jgi:Alpha-L-fucosidase